MSLYLLSLECKEPKSFSWEKYLEETGTQAAPARAFKVVWYTSMQIFTVLCYSSLNTDMWFCVVVFFQRPLHGFQFGMKVEAVDKRNPMLIRVATIADTEDHRLKVGDVSSWWCFLSLFFFPVLSLCLNSCLPSSCRSTLMAGVQSTTIGWKPTAQICILSGGVKKLDTHYNILTVWHILRLSLTLTRTDTQTVLVCPAGCWGWGCQISNFNRWVSTLDLCLYFTWIRH